MRRASTASYSTNLKEFGSYGMVDSKRNLKSFSDPDAVVPRATTNTEKVKAKRNSLFGFSFDLMALDEEAECTKQNIEAKALEAPKEIMEAHKQVVRRQNQSAAEHVVSDEKTWKKFQEQMRAGKGKTGMALRQNLDGLLQATAQGADATNQQPSQPQAQPTRRRRSSLTDFATSLIRGTDRPQPRQSIATTSAAMSDDNSVSSFATWCVGQQEHPSRQRTSSGSMTSPPPRNVKSLDSSQDSLDVESLYSLSDPIILASNSKQNSWELSARSR